MSNRQGPLMRIVASCGGCLHARFEHYAVQGDRGYDAHCDHPQSPKTRIGDTTSVTPDWCPLLPAARARLLTSLTSTETHDPK